MSTMILVPPGPPAAAPLPPVAIAACTSLWVALFFFLIYSSHPTAAKRSLDFPGGSDGKASVYNVGDLGLIPGSGRFSGEGNGNPLKYSCLECFIATLSIRPTLCIPLCVQSLFSVYICVYTPALQIGSSVPFSRFHIYALICKIYFSLSDLLSSVL